MPTLSMLISACFPPPILIWKRRWRRVGYDGTCSTVCPRSRYAFLHWRDRQSDIPILVDYYIKQFSKSWLIEPPHLSASVLGALCNHDWPGNIRELRNVVSRLLLHSLDGAVTEALVRETLHEWDNISGQTAKPAAAPLAIRISRNSTTGAFQGKWHRSAKP